MDREARNNPNTVIQKFLIRAPWRRKARPSEAKAKPQVLGQSRTNKLAVIYEKQIHTLRQLRLHRSHG